jgi:glycosyltransferase involved in cell wall biosynthesis
MAGAIAVSDAVAEDFRQSVGSTLITTILNGIDVERFRPSPGDGAALDRAAGLAVAASGTLRVGLVATYARWKGHEVFFRAAARLRELDPGLGIRFYAVGGPIYRTSGSQLREEELRSLLHQLHLEGNAGLVKFVDNTASVYPSLDIVIHASTRPEPFGLTIAEAMACARPVIAAHAGGVPELVAHGQDSWTVPAGDVDALAHAIGRLARDEHLRALLGYNARRKAEGMFDQRRAWSQLTAFYRRLLEPQISALGREDRQPTDLPPVFSRASSQLPNLP